MAVRFRLNFDALLDTDVISIAGGSLTFYATGTTTPKTIYTDEGLTTPAANPYTLDSAGEHGDIWCDIWATDYRVIVKDSLGATVPNGDVDPIFGHTSFATLDDLDALTSFYAPPIFWQGKPSDAELYPVINIPFAMQLPASLTGSIFTVETNPTATATFTLYKNGLSIGTIAFSTGGVPTATFAAAISFAAGDKFSITAPTPQDSTLADVAMSFVFTVL